MSTIKIVLAAAFAFALAAADAQAKSALVIVVENNDSATRAGASLFLRALDAVGEPLYAGLLRAAAGERWDRVVVLSDETASFDRFSRELRALDAGGYAIDVLLDIHG